MQLKRKAFKKRSKNITNFRNIDKKPFFFFFYNEFGLIKKQFYSDKEFGLFLRLQ